MHVVFNCPRLLSSMFLFVFLFILFSIVLILILFYSLFCPLSTVHSCDNYFIILHSDKNKSPLT